MKLTFLLITLTQPLFANPYPDPNMVPKDPPWPKFEAKLEKTTVKELQEDGYEIIRVDVKWDKEKFTVERAILEKSGTEGLLKRAQHPDKLGSYQGVLSNGESSLFDSTGTGSEMRLLTRAMTFRFPKVEGTLKFEMYAENPKTAAIEKVISQNIQVRRGRGSSKDLDIRVLKRATEQPALKVNVYSDGYVQSKGGDADSFFQDAQRVVEVFKTNQFPEFERFEMVGVYAASNEELGAATDLGLPVPERNSFLGLYYPYWDNFGRWYNIVYPTREMKFRDGVGMIPYDYPVVLIDSSEYWGVGNFNELTAIPAHHASFTYLLLHEFGHYFGLNEEYESGGKTELAFSPLIQEPWSQNITFHPKRGELKWESDVNASTALPTPSSAWTGNGPWGAYRGGYAQTQPLGKSHKPGLKCMMNSGGKFCPVCVHAIRAKIHFDVLGQN